MTTIRDYIKKCEFVKSNLLDEQEKIILKNENRIINLNVSQFEEGIGSDDKVLVNSNKIFTGFYKYSKPNKSAGQLYDFYITGEFLGNFQVDMLPNLVQLNIFSTGTGTDDKKLFFDGYDNLYGLNTENSEVLNWEILYPEIMNYIKKYL